MMDLSSIDTTIGANDGFDVQIFNPKTKEDMGIVIRVLGEDSDAYKKCANDQTRKYQARVGKGGFRSSNFMPSPEETDQKALDLLVAATVGWKTLAEKDHEGNIITPEKNTILLHGKQAEFSKENVYLAYGIPAVREQVATAVQDRANFIKS
jgi:hypothetical protein